MRTAIEILKDIVIDVNAMRLEEPSGDYFGPFVGFETETSDGFPRDNIEWPNLSLLVREAETMIEKEEQHERKENQS
jgi:hypothetical protein